ncbi:hypothetical protein VCV18_005220 [Metarhizium anisopliae]
MKNFLAIRVPPDWCTSIATSTASAKITYNVTIVFSSAQNGSPQRWVEKGLSQMLTLGHGAGQSDEQ